MNDTLGTFQSLMPKDSSNLVQGNSTYGFWEYVVYLDTTIYDLWIMCAEQQGLGLGLGMGMVISSLITKGVFAPVIVYSQIVGQKMRLMQPDIDEITASVKRYQSSGNREGAKMERNKLKQMRKTHGVYPIISMLNIFQMPLHLVYITMINRLAYNYEINPAIMTDGFAWFTDLSSPDPTGILPVMGGIISLLNIMTTSANNNSTMMRKIRKYLVLMPLLSIPVWMTFPVAFNLYWLTTSSVQLLIMNLFRIDRFRAFMGIPEYLPGSKLERLNSKVVRAPVDQPKVTSHQPKLSARKKAQNV